MTEPLAFSRTLALKICRRVATGEVLGAILSGPKMPSERRLARWLNEHPGFARDMLWACRLAQWVREGKASGLVEAAGKAELPLVKLRLHALKREVAVCERHLAHARNAASSPRAQIVVVNVADPERRHDLDSDA